MKIIKIIVIAVCILIATLGSALSVFFLAAPKHENVSMVGHRGYSSKYLENTKIAIIQAAKHGNEGIETDVRYTKDGVYVLAHDNEAVFHDGSKLTISDSTYAELTVKPLKNDINDEEAYLCTLKEYLEICKEYNVFCLIELKDDYTNEQIRGIFNDIQNYYSLDRCVLQSFSLEVLIEAQTMFPEARYMLIWSKNRGDYTKCFDYGFDINAHYKSLSRKMVKEFHDRDLKVAAWTCNDIFSLYYCYWNFVDFIVTDVY